MKTSSWNTDSLKNTHSLYLAITSGRERKTVNYLQRQLNSYKFVQIIIEKIVYPMQKRFFPRTRCAVHKTMINENFNLSKNKFAVLKCCACAATSNSIMILRLTKLNFSIIKLNERSLEVTGDGPGFCLV